MKYDHLGNELYLSTVNKFNRVSLPAEIADYLRAKDMMISNADYKSDDDDLYVTLITSGQGFLINHFSSNVSLVKKTNLSYRGQHINDYERALSYVCAFGGEFEMSKKNIVRLPNALMKLSGISKFSKGENSDVVIRLFEHGYTPLRGFVQVMDKDIWNKRFPDLSV